MRGRRGALLVAVAVAAGATLAVPGAARANDAGLIAFSGGTGSPLNVDIWVVAPDGTDLRRLTTDPAPDRHPDWSPDGTRVAFERAGDIWTVAPDGSAPAQLTSGVAVDTEPAWSPDGSRLAFVRDGDIWTMAADGSGAVPVTTGSHPESDPSWSPDGRRLVFTVSPYGSAAAASLWMITADGRSWASVDPVDAGATSAGDWSPVTDRITFLHRVESTSGGGYGGSYTVVTWYLAVMDGDGTDVRRVSSTGTSDPSWSPDGRCVAQAESDPYYYTASHLHVRCPQLVGWSRQTVTLPGIPLAESPDWRPAGPVAVPADDTLVDTVLVGAGSHASASGAVAVEAGGRYRITARGAYHYNNFGGEADAECSSAAGGDPLLVRNRFPTYRPPDGDALDLYVAGRNVDWQAAEPDHLGCDRSHVHHLDFTARATGVPQYQLVDDQPGDNRGVLVVELRRLP